MILLFAHDHRLYQYDNRFYTTGGMSDEVTKKYTEIFGEMHLLCRAQRVAEKKDISQLKRVDNTLLKVAYISKPLVYPTKKNLEYIKTQVMNADCIICRLPSFLGLYTAFISNNNKKNTLIEVVGSTFGSYWYKNIVGKIIAFPAEIITKYIVQKSEYIIYVSEDYLQKKYPCAKHTLACSDVILQDRDDSVLNNRIEKIRRLHDKNIIIGTLAQVDQKYKGHETVFRAIAELKKMGWNIEYRLAGSGSTNFLCKSAKKLGIEKNVKFLGILPHESVHSYIDELDVYIQPSLTEGMPRSVIEALYRACPVIVSNAGGMYELVSEKYIFRKGNYNSLIEIINNLDRNSLLTMAKRNYEFSSKFKYDYLMEKRRMFLTKYKEEVKSKNGMV